MQTGSVSVKDAINEGLKSAKRPLYSIPILPTIVCIVLIYYTHSFVYLLLIPFSITLSVFYSKKATNKWRLWAYRYVNDIHQLQRSAEYAGLLPYQSYNKPNALATHTEKEELKELQKRFEEAEGFIDDKTIPSETVITPGADFTKQFPKVTLTQSGILLYPGKLIPWDHVYNERIPSITYLYASARTGGYNNSSSERVFRFNTDDNYYEFQLGSLTTTVWMLDLLLYTYRGRFTTKQSM
ncbi:MAG: hypothetical protein BGO70_03160 [Bacteroidetes bacterium 43-93]|nr:hypothetical protein [Bacteroidota bacterium]OJW98899.1 MAG: hypothetical protein BGO70_03160 [Bacteroidetes bacterium 43-93]